MTALITIVAIISALLASILLLLHMRTRQQQTRLVEKLLEAEDALKAANQACNAAEAALHIREQSLGRLLNSTRDMAMVYAIESTGKVGRFSYVNEAACAELGYSHEQLLAKTPIDIELVAGPSGPTGTADADSMSLANTDRLSSQDAIAARYFELLLARTETEKKVVYETRYVTQTGTVIPVEVTACRVALNESPVVVCLAHDIRERKKREVELLAKDRLLRDFINKAAIGVAVYDAQGNLISVNPACVKMFGAPDAGEFERINLLDNRFLRAGVRDAIRRGDSLQTEITVDFDDVVRLAILVSTRKGEAHFQLHINNMGLDEHYNPRGHIVQVVDITEQRANEETLRTMGQQLRQAQKMEAIGTLAGGIAHDFNNVLTPIMGYAGMALELPAGDTRIPPFLQEILSAARRARELVAQILAFSRQDSGKHSPMHLTPIIKEVAKQRAAALPPDINIQCAIKEADDLVRASPTQIHQILTNLTKNAEQAMKGMAGTIELRLTSFVLTSLHRREFPSLVTREYVREGLRQRFLRLSVRDAGCGMSPETIKQIFETFFTTKREGEGTGMGLAVVRAHVTAMGGAISVESTPGKGTVFHIALPLVEPSAEEVEQAPQLAHGSRERILFVDDEIAVVRMASLMLESLGYEAVVTSQSTKALDIFRADPGRFDLMITDQVMPEMTGIELAIEVLRLRPDMPIILCTGFSEKVSKDDALNRGIRVYLPKPVERCEMADAIRRALATPASAAEAEQQDS